MSEKNGFEALKRDFPVFEVKNKTNVSKVLDLIGDDDVVVPARTSVKLPSSKFYQVPSNVVFQMVTPNAAALVEYGLIKRAQAAPAPAPTGEVAEDPKPNAGVPESTGVPESKDNTAEADLNESKAKANLEQSENADEDSDPAESKEETTKETKVEETKASGKKTK